jgi:hypothetical protein
MTVEPSSVDRVAERLAAMAPGPGMVAALDGLDVGALTAGGLLDAAAAWGCRVLGCGAAAASCRRLRR